MNRTDLGVNYADSGGITTPAAGGQAAPPPAAPAQAPAAPTGPTPDQTPFLNSPTARPGEPITAGLPDGPGPGPEILPTNQASKADTAAIAKYLPVLRQAAELNGAPQSFRAFVRFLQAQ